MMCCPRSSYSWDVVVQRVGKKLFFDKRDDSDFDLLTVSETATEPPQEDNSNSINSPRSLALEATFINHNFSQQVLKMVSFTKSQCSLLSLGFAENHHFDNWDLVIGGLNLYDIHEITLCYRQAPRGIGTVSEVA